MIPFASLLEFEEERRKEQFRVLHQAYERKLYAYALSILKDPHKAEDAVSMAFLKVAKHFEKIFSLPCTKREAYLVILMRNTALDLLREEGRFTGEEPSADLPARRGDPEAALAYRRLVDLIRSMPDPYRQALELVLVLEWTPKEAANFLHCKESTLHTRLRRGKALLRERLKEEGWDND